MNDGLKEVGVCDLVKVVAVRNGGEVGGGGLFIFFSDPVVNQWVGFSDRVSCDGQWHEDPQWEILTGDTFLYTSVMARTETCLTPQILQLVTSF